ncbi:MAG: hypothetical protein HRU12_09145, partial [Phaeodactylibacter sp.]|nr:hypothetical protein [Phaeodactylibacter sp.]
MLQYLLKRLLIFLPTLLVISLLSFGLSKVAPGDPVEQRNRDMGGGMQRPLKDADRVYRETSAYLGLDKPVFYLSLSSAAYPDTLYRIFKRDERENLVKLIQQYGNWDHVSDYYQSIREADRSTEKLLKETETVRNVRPQVKQLYLAYKEERIHSLLDKIASQTAADSTLQVNIGPVVERLTKAYGQLLEQATPARLYIPDIKWYGFDNQYHNWITDFLTLDFGESFIDSRPVADKMADALRWTLTMNLLAILVAYLLSIPIGVF